MAADSSFPSTRYEDDFEIYFLAKHFDGHIYALWSKQPETRGSIVHFGNVRPAPLLFHPGHVRGARYGGGGVEMIPHANWPLT